MTTKQSFEAALASNRATTPDPLAYSINAAVQISGQSRTGIYAAIKSGALIAHKRGARTVILAKNLISWLEELPRLNTGKAA